MEEETMKPHQMHKIDLATIEGSGDFPCPSCGARIAPEDETENVYTILDTKMKGNSLQELVIQCNKCESKIHLVGFLSPSPPSPK